MALETWRLCPASYAMPAHDENIAAVSGGMSSAQTSGYLLEEPNLLGYSCDVRMAGQLKTWQRNHDTEAVEIDISERPDDDLYFTSGTGIMGLSDHINPLAI